MRSIDPSIALRCADMAAELADIGYWWMDVETQAIRWSPNMYKIFGIEPGPIPSLDYAMQFVHADDRSTADANLKANLLGGSARTASRIVQPSGEVRYIEARNASDLAPDGQVVAVYGTVLDVTERITAENALARSEARYRLLAENSCDVTACCRPDGTFSFLTSGIRNLLGFEVEELIGRNAADFIHPDDRSRVSLAFTEHMKRGKDAGPLQYEYRAIAKDGREVWLAANPSGVFDPATGTLIEIQDILRDVTERKALDQQLLTAKEEAEASARVKAEFLSNISHELRTPLTAIIGYSGLLAETRDLPEPVRRHIERIDTGGRTLLSLINGILDFSRLEAGRFTIIRQVCSPTKIARECLDLLSLTAEAKGVRLEYVQSDDVPPFALIDPDAYRQVLVNLIGNAVKFTDAGYVRLTVEFNASEGQLSVSVADTGVGIPSTETGKLFRRFSQIDGSSTREHSGAGLGLAICKGLVEAIGGDISVTSEPGVGSVFSFRIPATLANSGAENAAPDRPGVNARILIVDDNASIRKLVRTMLESVGSEVTEAADGPAGLEAATTWPFDLILLDLRMPQMTGNDVARALHERRGPNANVPIVAFTASSEAFEDSFCQNFGFNAVLAKPVVVRDLLALVAHFTDASNYGEKAC